MQFLYVSVKCYFIEWDIDQFDYIYSDDVNVLPITMTVVALFDDYKNVSDIPKDVMRDTLSMILSTTTGYCATDFDYKILTTEYK